MTFREKELLNSIEIEPGWQSPMLVAVTHVATLRT